MHPNSQGFAHDLGMNYLPMEHITVCISSLFPHKDSTERFEDSIVTEILDLRCLPRTFLNSLEFATKIFDWLLK